MLCLLTGLVGAQECICRRRVELLLCNAREWAVQFRMMTERFGGPVQVLLPKLRASLSSDPNTLHLSSASAPPNTSALYHCFPRRRSRVLSSA